MASNSPLGFLPLKSLVKAVPSCKKYATSVAVRRLPQLLYYLRPEHRDRILLSPTRQRKHGGVYIEVHKKILKKDVKTLEVKKEKEIAWTDEIAEEIEGHGVA